MNKSPLTILKSVNKVLLTLCIASAGIFYLNNNENINSNDLLEFRQEVTSVVSPIAFDNKNILAGGVFLYSSDYNTFVSLAGFNLPDIITDEAQEFIYKDPIFSESLYFHKQDICFITSTLELPVDTYVYNAMALSNAIEEGYYYISCPIYVNSHLVGYNGVLVIDNTKDYLFITKNYVKLMTNAIADELSVLLRVD